MKKKLKNFGIEVKSIIELLLKSSKKNTFFLIFTNIISGLMIPVEILIWKYFIDSVVVSISSKKIFMPVLILIIHFCVGIVDNLIIHMESYFEEMEVDYINKFLTGLTINKTSKLEMSYFDEKKNYDIIQKVNTESTQRLINILSMTMNFVRNFVTLVGIVSVLLLLNGWIIIFCLMISVPSALISYKMSKKQYKIFNSRIEDLRKITEIKNILVNYENVKE